MNFAYNNPTKIFFGQNQISTITDAISGDQKILVIYGGGSIKNNGVYDQVVNALAGKTWIEFSGVEPNPTKETLDKAISLAKEKQITFILAVGGGSVIDGAKYVAAGALYYGDAWDILTRAYQITKAIPLGAILTLPATGSESNGNSVITKTATQDKLSFASPLVKPTFAILDPNTMKTLPDRQLINGLLDSWVHICEQYITKVTGAMVQDGYSESLLRSLKTLGDNFDKRSSYEWNANLMLVANQALNGFIAMGVEQDWATHLIGHELTALWGVDHGVSLAIIQPSLLRNQIEAKRAKLEQMGRNVFGLEQSSNLAESTIDAIESFYHQLGIDTKFTSYSVTHSNKEAAIDTVIAQLEKHGMTALGENQAIDLNASREILTAAFA